MKTYDVIVVGAGPGGYVAAIRAAQIGMNTVLIEKAKLGGMCLNWGCVPARRLMESARAYSQVLGASAFGVEGFDSACVRFNWKKAVGEKERIVGKLVKGIEFLLKKNKVQVISGEARLLRGHDVQVAGEVLTAGHIIIATGSRPDRAPLATLPANLVVEVDELFSRTDVPEKLVIAGGDTVACETASMLSLIRRRVTVAAPEERLMPWMDESLSRFVADKFKKSGIRVITGVRITSSQGGISVGDEIVEADAVVNCSRRTAILPPMEDTPLDLRDGFVEINEFMQTSVPSVYAIGDVTGRIFAHVASAQGVCAVHHIAGLREPVDYLRMPVTLYMEPEIGAVGFTEEELKQRGIEYVKGEFPMTASSKALIEGNTEGFVKILADQKYGEVLGVHVVASHAADLIGEAAMCMRTEGTLDDLIRVVHAHPTVSETFREAGFKASGKPLHM